MRRLPVRIRLTLGFAAVMAVLLAATGFSCISASRRAWTAP